MIDFEFAQTQIFRFKIGIQRQVFAHRLRTQLVPEPIDDLPAEAFLADALVMLTIVHALEQLQRFLERLVLDSVFSVALFCLPAYVVKDAVIELLVRLHVVDHLLEVVKHAIDLSENITNHRLIRLDCLMVVAVLVQVPARLEQFAQLHGVGLRVADLVIDRQHVVGDQCAVERLITRHIYTACVPQDVIDLVDVDAVETVADDVKKVALLVWTTFRLALDQVHDELGVDGIRFYSKRRVLFQYLVEEHG